MLPNYSKELMEFHYNFDPLFKQLCDETDKEKDDAKFQLNLALISLVLDGKIAITKDNFGELLFEKAQPN